MKYIERTLANVSGEKNLFSPNRILIVSYQPYDIGIKKRKSKNGTIYFHFLPSPYFFLSSFQHWHLFTFQSVCSLSSPSVCLSVFSICMSVSLYTFLNVCQSVYLHFCLFVNISICLFFYISVCLLFFLSFCSLLSLSVYLFLLIFLSVCEHFCLSVSMHPCSVCFLSFHCSKIMSIIPCSPLCLV